MAGEWPKIRVPGQRYELPPGTRLIPVGIDVDGVAKPLEELAVTLPLDASGYVVRRQAIFDSAGQLLGHRHTYSFAVELPPEPDADEPLVVGGD